MAVTTCMTDQFRQEVLEGAHNFLLTGGDAFRLGLFDAAAGVGGTYDKDTAVYTDISGDENAASGYTAKGELLTRVDPTHDGTNHVAYTDFSNDITWSSITMTASAAFIINDDHANDTMVSLHDFGGDKTASGGNFVVQMPEAAHATAILRFA